MGLQCVDTRKVTLLRTLVTSLKYTTPLGHPGVVAGAGTRGRDRSGERHPALAP